MGGTRPIPAGLPKDVPPHDAAAADPAQAAHDAVVATVPMHCAHDAVATVPAHPLTKPAVAADPNANVPAQPAVPGTAGAMPAHPSDPIDPKVPAVPPTVPAVPNVPMLPKQLNDGWSEARALLTAASTSTSAQACLIASRYARYAFSNGSPGPRESTDWAAPSLSPAGIAAPLSSSCGTRANRFNSR